jgi:hypothetical protein
VASSADSSASSTCSSSLPKICACYTVVVCGVVVAGVNTMVVREVSHLCEWPPRLTALPHPPAPSVCQRSAKGANVEQEGQVRMAVLRLHNLQSHKDPTTRLTLPTRFLTP